MPAQSPTLSPTLSAITAGIARIVLGNARLDLAHQVGADVRAFGEDAAAQPRENRDQRAAEAQADQGLQDVVERALVLRVGVEQREITGDTEQPQAHHQQAGDGAALERDVERLLQAAARGFGGAHVGAHRDVHADDAERPENSAPMAKPQAVAQPSFGMKPIARNRICADDRDGRVLALEVGARAFANRRCDFLHARVARGQRNDPPRLQRAVDDRDQRAGDGEPETSEHRFLPDIGPCPRASSR